MEDVFIVEHAFKHGVSPSDIKHAWRNFVRKQHRGVPYEGEVVMIGPDTKGRLMQIVAAERQCGTVIYHANRPPTSKVLKELGMERRKR